MERWTGYVVYTGDIRKVYKMLIGRRERKRSLEILKCRNEYNIKTDLKEDNVRVWTEFILLRTETTGGDF
jgi:hypothetical protein